MLTDRCECVILTAGLEAQQMQSQLLLLEELVLKLVTVLRGELPNIYKQFAPSVCED